MAGFIGLDDAKAQLRVSDASEDVLIQSLIDAAARHIERRWGYVAEERTETFLFDCFARELELKLRPVDTGTIAVDWLDGNGDSQSFTDLRVIDKHGTVRILPAIGFSWPAAVNAAGAVSVTATVGYGATDEDGAATAPDCVKHASRLCVAAWFEDREAGAPPAAVRMLLDAERARRV